MTSKLARERLEKIKSWRETYGAGSNVMLPAEEAEELACIALAAMDSKPVAWTDEQELRDVDRGGCGYLFTVNPVTPHADERRIILLYRHAQPASEREQVRREHAEWSQATFGNVGPVGPLKHLSKEALEAAAEPGDLSEWADMQFLMWDAQRRAGITDAQITQAMIEKLAVNKQREWPEPKDGEPRLHINEQPVLTGNSPIIGIDLASGPDRTVEVRYVAPPGYVMVPKEMTDEIGEAIAMQANCCGGIALDIYDAMLAAAPQEVKGE